MDQPTLYRLVTTDLDMADGHTLTGRAVPYDTPADVADLLPDGQIDRYREGFRSSAFENAFAAPHRVRLIDGHTIDGTEGPSLAVATSLRHGDDGLLADFRMLTEADAEKVRTLLDVGVAGLSVGFAAARGGTSVDADGVRWRTRALLRHVSLEPAGSYPGAEVLAFRADEPDVLAVAEAEHAAEMADLEEFLARAQAEQEQWNARILHPASGAE